MMEYASVTIDALPLWNMYATASSAIAFSLMIMLCTKYYSHIWRISIIYAGIGWLCSFYAGVMGNWYIGWFAWVITLSVAIFLRGILLYIDNTDNDGDDKALDNKEK